MKILHWNIHGWRDADGIDNVERVTKLIGDQDPDVVSLVEVDETWGQPMNIEQVANQLGYHWAFIPAFEYRQQGGFGNALLSKKPFLSVQQRHLLPPSLYDGTEQSEPRTLLLAEIESPLGRVQLGSTHLPRSSSQSRQRASERVLAAVQSADTPWIICGDFNQSPAQTLNGSPILVAPESVPTYPTPDPVEAIDYAIASGVDIGGSALMDRETSDHFPVVIKAVEASRSGD